MRALDVQTVHGGPGNKCNCCFTRWFMRLAQRPVRSLKPHTVWNRAGTPSGEAPTNSELLDDMIDNVASAVAEAY